jgi:hypothetical protein
MKKIVSIIISAAACMFVFSSCQTKETKAEKVIDSYFKSEMPNYNSYEPIETKVIPAKNVVRNNAKLMHILLANDIDFKISCSVSGLCDDDGLFDTIKQYLSDLDSNEIIGWEAIHKYRFQDGNGNWKIVSRHFLIDKEFNSLLMFPYSTFLVDYNNNLVKAIDTANIYTKKFDGFDLQLLQLGE